MSVPERRAVSVEGLASGIGQWEGTRLSLPPGLPQEEWLRVGELLRRIENSVQWWIGDWAAYGERWYGEGFYQAVDGMDYADATVDNFRAVARAIPPGKRQEGVKWSVHAEVAPLYREGRAESEEAADEILKRAKTEGLSVRRTRDLVKEARHAPFGPEARAEPCPHCGGNGLLNGIGA